MIFKDSLCFNVTQEHTILAEVILLPIPYRMQRRLDREGHSKNPKMAYMHRLWTRATHRGKGFARIVMDAAVLWADDNKVDLVLRVVPFDNKTMSQRRLEAFYRGYSFSAVPRWKGVRIRSIGPFTGIGVDVRGN